MEYNFKAHSTKYNGVIYRSRLEATWACFFDVFNFKYEYEPFDLSGWTPDFLLTWECGHSECDGSHSILIEVKPYTSLNQFEGHPCTKYDYGWDDLTQVRIPADASACFGNTPGVTRWAMFHGASGGDYDISYLCEKFSIGVNIMDVWRYARNQTQYRFSNSRNTYVNG